MFESFLITSRETLEMSLVVGIVLSYLNKTGHNKYKKTVFLGIIAGIIASVNVAMLFSLFADGFKGVSEQIFEGTTMIIGAFLLTTMILWMMKQRHISKTIGLKVQKYIDGQKPMFSHFGIFLLIGTAILREGVETIIFLNAVNYANGLNLLSGFFGILVAILVGYLFFLGSKHINLKALFTVSSILLILFAAGLAASSVHEFEEVGLINPIVEHVWDLNPKLNPDGTVHPLHEEGIIGGFLAGLFGYRADPSLMQLMIYLIYICIIGVLYLRIEMSRNNVSNKNLHNSK